jgi:hypothetical protein
MAHLAAPLRFSQRRINGASAQKTHTTKDLGEAPIRAPGKQDTNQAEQYARASSKWDGHPNLALRPEKPALGRGRLQRQIGRAFLATGSDVLSATTILDWCYPRRRARLPSWNRWKVARICSELCVPVGRADTRGRPILWRLRNSDSGK